MWGRLGKIENALRLFLESSTILGMEKRRNKNGAWLLLGIVLLAAFLGLKIWQKYRSPTASTALEKENPAITPISPADWKTYTNEEFNFSIRYPEEMRVASENYGSPADDGKNKNLFQVIFYPDFSEVNTLKMYAVSIQARKFNNSASAGEWLTDEICGIQEIKNYEEVSINGLEAVKCEDKMSPVKTAQSYRIAHNEIGYGISPYDSSATNPLEISEANAVYDKIAQSFRVLK